MLLHLKRKPVSAAKIYLVSKKPELPYRLLWEVSIRWGCRKTMACLKHSFVPYVVYIMHVTPHSTLLLVWSWVRFSFTVPCVSTLYILERKLGMLLAIANAPQWKISIFVCCQFVSSALGDTSVPTRVGLPWWGLVGEGGHGTMSPWWPCMPPSSLCRNWLKGI